MTQAIQTRYLGPSNFRGSRIKASASGGSVTVAYDAGLTIDGNHEAACKALIAKMEWDVSGIHSGTLANGDQAHVLTFK